MLVTTSWKSRPISQSQTATMMSRWAKLEADLAADPSMERVCWYLNVDGSGGYSVSRVTDQGAAAAFSVELGLALGEFLELESKIVLELDDAMPAIMRGMERINAA